MCVCVCVCVCEGELDNEKRLWPRFKVLMTAYLPGTCEDKR